MNKILLIFASLLIALSANAYFTYMKITTIEGTDHYIGVSGLTITTDKDSLYADDGYGKTLTMCLDSVSTLELVGYVASTNSLATTPEGEVEVFGTNGVSKGLFSSLDYAWKALPAGIYIVKSQSGQTLKIRIGK